MESLVTFVTSPLLPTEGAMNQRMLATRRSFLRAVGAGFAALPCFRLLENNFAQAQGAELPLKFITVYIPHGICAEYYNLGQRGAAAAVTESETNFDITYDNCVLQPFDDAATYGKSFKDKIMVIDGMELLSGANGHETAGTILTGSRISGKPANSSLDQFIAVSAASARTPASPASTRRGQRLRSIPACTFLRRRRRTAAQDHRSGPATAAVPRCRGARRFRRGRGLTRQNMLGHGMVDYLRGDVNRCARAGLASEKLS